MLVPVSEHSTLAADALSTERIVDGGNQQTNNSVNGLRFRVGTRRAIISEM